MQPFEKARPRRQTAPGRENLARSESGATAVEFALVAAPFLALLVGLFQTALVFFAGRVLDETTEQASRYIMTGQAQNANMTAAGFATYVCSANSLSRCSPAAIS